MRGRPTRKKRSAFGERLATARHAAGLSQEALAAKINVERTVVRHHERNVTDPRVGFVLRCCDALDVPLHQLLGTSETLADSETAIIRTLTKHLLKLGASDRKLALRQSRAVVRELEKARRRAT